ncbi:MAG: hypothetical protein K0M58_09385 [Thiobacillus sp.]|nr:hypothetical protein [Thiobacillus sp.]
MALPPFPADALDLPDYDLGGLLLGWFIMAQAEDAGITVYPIPEAFAERVRLYVLTIETETAKNAAIEKALHKAASGNFEAAGKFLREHINNGAVALKFIPIGINKLAQAKEFGRKGAEGNKKEGEGNRQTVLDAARAILAGRTREPSERELAKLIETKTGIPQNTVRGHLARLRKDKTLD